MLYSIAKVSEQSNTFQVMYHQHCSITFQLNLFKQKKHIIQLNNNISQFNKNIATQIQKIYKRKTKDNI